MINLKYSRRHFTQYSFAVLGAGPAGIFTGKHILKSIDNSRIDFYDKNPYPYGLCRTGIAPDHQDMKKVVTDLSEVMENERARFMGNVEVGKDTPFDVLRHNYSSLVLTYGADSEPTLNIDNEFAYGCFSARNFVKWYNGDIFEAGQSPSFSDKLKLKHIKDVVIIGNGNVALDVTRILSHDVESLSKYDVPQPMLEVLAGSGVKNIHIIGRRGAMEAAFTTKEIRELSKISRINVYKDELEESINSSHADINARTPAERRQAARKLDLVKSFNIVEERNGTLYESPSQGKNIFLRFFLEPSEIFINNEKRVVGISLSCTKEGFKKMEKIETPLIFKSIGYKSQKLFDEIGFDHKKSIIINKEGIVFDNNMKPCENIFTTGWVKTGPRGIIDWTLRDSFETAGSIFKAFEKNLFNPKTPDYKYITSLVENKCKVPISFKDWKIIDSYEIEEGKKLGKVREKIIDFDKMLALINH